MVNRQGQEGSGESGERIGMGRRSAYGLLTSHGGEVMSGGSADLIAAIAGIVAALPAAERAKLAALLSGSVRPPSGTGLRGKPRDDSQDSGSFR